MVYPCEHVEFSVECMAMAVCYTLANTWNLVWKYMAMVVCYTLANTWNLVWSIWSWLYVIPLQTRGIWCGVYGHGCMLYPCKHVEFSVEYMVMVLCYTLATRGI